MDADHNSQMMLYALGGLAAYGFLYDVEIVRMSIIQPRPDNISTCEMTVTELEAWGESIRPTAKLTYEGKGEQHPGDWCRFCRAKPVCKACADEALALCREDFLDLDAGAFDDNAEESDMTAPYEADTQTAVFKQPGLIPIAELAEILPTLNRISSWIEAVFAFVSSEAINHGVPIPGYKVVEGRSKRVFTDTKAVVDTAVAKANVGRTRNLPEHAPDDWKLFKSYCIQDVETERDIRRRLEKFPLLPQERDFYHMDQRINDRGILIDKEA